MVDMGRLLFPACPLALQMPLRDKLSAREPGFVPFCMVLYYHLSSPKEYGISILNIVPKGPQPMMEAACSPEISERSSQHAQPIGCPR